MRQTKRSKRLHLFIPGSGKPFCAEPVQGIDQTSCVGNKKVARQSYIGTAQR